MNFWGRENLTENCRLSWLNGGEDEGNCIVAGRYCTFSML